VHGGGSHRHGGSASTLRSGNHGSGRHSSNRPSDDTNVVIVNNNSSNMVHGGASHQHGGSASTLRSGNHGWEMHSSNRRSDDTNVVIVNNNSSALPPYRWHGSQTRSPQWAGDMDMGGFFANPNVEYSHPSEGQWNTTTSRGHGDTTTPPYRCLGLFLSIVMAVVLLALSGINETWIINAGESRRIETPILNRQIKLQSNSNEDMVVVYHLQTCPPLTGPPVQLQDRHDMILGASEFQYDFFFLNAGSTVDLNVIQSEGASNLYILQGANALRRLESPSDDDPFGKDAVVTGFSGDGGSANLSYRVKQSDVYTLVYDNVGPRTGVLSTQHNISLTTYELQNVTPICKDLKRDCQILRPDHGSCLIVQATIADKTAVVTVTIHGRRRWLAIFAYSIMPYLVALLVAYLCRPKSSYQPVGVFDHTAPDDERPPPTVPRQPVEAIPSAPMESQVLEEEENVPIVSAEYVVPIATLVETIRGPTNSKELY
jgi:hypothetical protein